MPMNNEIKEKCITVLMADDHRLFREMLYHTLSDEEDIKIVGEARDGREAVDLTKKLRPDILLLDISMPRIDGIEAAEIIHKECPKTKIVILTATEDNEYVFKLIRAGAVGYLLKDTSMDHLISAIRSAHYGESVIQPKVAGTILKEFARLMEETDQKPSDKYTEKLDLLTERELEVVKLVAKGLNNKEISNQLYIGETTVKTHVANAMHKLNMRDRVELVLFAVEAGFGGKIDRKTLSE